MRALAVIIVAVSLLLSAACSREQKVAQQIQTGVEKSLDQAGFGRDLKVDIDHTKRVVTLDGAVRSTELKARAAAVAASAAPEYVVANQLSVEPVDQEEKAREIQANLDAAIENNFKALLTANKLDEAKIRFTVKNGVLTLEGEVPTAETRGLAEQLGAGVPNVAQVVNKIDVKR